MIKAKVIGALTFLSALYFVGAWLYVWNLPKPTEVSSLLVGVVLVAVLWVQAIVIYDIYYLIRLQWISWKIKILWTVLLLLGNWIAMMFFWYFYIWRPRKSET